LAAARSLFESCGYAVTTIEAIAEQALVSPKTMDAVFGSKFARLSEVINPVAFSPSARQLIEELRATEDEALQLASVAQITRQAYEPRAELAGTTVDCGSRGPRTGGWSAADRGEKTSKPGPSDGLPTRARGTDVLWEFTSYDLY
jgi:AcrR family transcriptional regulator